MNLLYKINDVEKGPVTIEEFNTLVDSGIISNDTMVRRKHLTVWVTADEMFSLDAADGARTDLKQGLGLVLDAAGFVGDIAEALADFSGAASNMKTMVNAFTPDRLKRKLIEMAIKRSKGLSSKDDFIPWYEQQVSLYGNPIALASGNVLNGFPNYVPLSRFTQLAGDGPAAEFVIMEQALVIYDPSFKPGAWKTVIPREELKEAKESGMNGERVQLTVDDFQASFEVDFNLGGRALGSLIQEWKLGSQKCPHCGYEGAPVMRYASFGSSKFGLTNGGFYLMLGAIFLSCGFLFWLPLILTSLRRKVTACTNCNGTI